jgi:putative phosphoribosyl transferase
MITAFANRIDAGQKLAAALSSYAKRSDHVVVGLARGGVSVAKEVADALKLPLDFISVRKLGVPRFPELAMGAVAGDVVYLDQETVEMAGVTETTVTRIVESEKQEVARREKLYRGIRKPRPLSNQTILLVDDGIATGATLHASILYLRKQHVRSIIVAVPVAAPASLARFQQEADKVVCLSAPASFFGVSQFYSEFFPVADEEVCNALKYTETT